MDIKQIVAGSIMQFGLSTLLKAFSGRTFSNIPKYEAFIATNSDGENFLLMMPRWQTLQELTVPECLVDDKHAPWPQVWMLARKEKGDSYLLRKYTIFGPSLSSTFFINYLIKVLSCPEPEITFPPIYGNPSDPWGRWATIQVGDAMEVDFEKWYTEERNDMGLELFPWEERAFARYPPSRVPDRGQGPVTGDWSQWFDLAANFSKVKEVAVKGTDEQTQVKRLERR